MKQIKKLFDDLVKSGFTEKQAIEYLTSFMVKFAMARILMKDQHRGSTEPREINNDINMEDVLKNIK